MELIHMKIVILHMIIIERITAAIMMIMLVIIIIKTKIDIENYTVPPSFLETLKY